MNIIRIVVAGLAGGLAGNGVLGALFSTPWVRRWLYDPAIQSPLFLEITPARDVPVSVAGLVLLSVVHAALFVRLAPAMPGASWPAKGAFWGLTIWLMYWVFQEWFIYYTLLREPVALCLFELALLLAGSLVEGLVIARLAKAGTSP